MLDRASRVWLVAFAWQGMLAAPAAATYQIAAWGSDVFGQVSGTPAGNVYLAIDGGDGFGLALTTNGSIAAWGLDASGQVSNAPTGPGHIAISAGGEHALAIKSDASIVSWGLDDFGQVSNSPPPSVNFFTHVAAGRWHSVALFFGGTITAWGRNDFGQSSAPTGPGHQAIAAGSFHSLALTANGSIVSWGNDSFGQVSNTPTGTGFVAISAGSVHSLALTGNGTIVAWGNDDVGQVSNTPLGSGYKAIAAGGGHSMALTANGTIVAWGLNDDGQLNAPAGPGHAAISGGGAHSLALFLENTGSPGCPPSINCPAPNPSDPNSVARLALFPGTPSVVHDNQAGVDLAPQCDVISVNNQPFPDDPFASFTGTLQLVPPTGSTPGELVVTQATIANNTGDPGVPGGGNLIRGDIPFACGEFYLTSPVVGSLVVEIDGTLEGATADGTVGGEELEITGVGRTLTVPNEPWTPPAEVLASWVSPTPAPTPVPMSATASKSGTYAMGPGIIGLKMNIILPVQESMQLPTSITATLVQNLRLEVPSLSAPAFAAAVALIVASALARSRSRRRTR